MAYKKSTNNTRRRIDEWNEPNRLILIRGWAMDGLTIEDISKNIGINKTTLYEWMKKSINISNALKVGRDTADYIVENALFNNAKNGNVVAQIFWLKNRKSKVWRERVEHFETQETETPKDFKDIFEEQVKGLKNEENSNGQ